MNYSESYKYFSILNSNSPSPFFLVSPIFIQNWSDFESTKYVIKGVLHREFIKGKREKL